MDIVEPGIVQRCQDAFECVLATHGDSSFSHKNVNLTLRSRADIGLESRELRVLVERGVPEFLRSDNVLTAESRPGRRHRNPECFLQSQATSNVVLDPVAFHG